MTDTTERRPPSDLTAERALIGAMLLDPDAVDVAVGGHGGPTLEPGDFYRPAHAQAFEGALALHAAGEPVDVVTLAAWLAAHPAGTDPLTATDLVAMQTEVPNSANAASYALIIHERAQLRALIAAAADVADLGYGADGDAASALDQAERLILGARDTRAARAARPVGEAIESALEYLDGRFGQDDITGVHTGFAELDRLLGGYQPSNLIILGARPAVGKSAFALASALAVARSGRPALFFSLEMSELELTQRILSSVARVNMTGLRNGHLHNTEWERMSQAYALLADMPLYLDDTANLTVLEAAAKARRVAKAAGGLGIIIIDYLQLMSAPDGGRRSDSRQNDVSMISRGLKLLAREMDCPVIALSQLSRNLEHRNDKRPVLSDLKESGSLEQDADVVAFLYRDDLYNPGTSDGNVAEVIVAKQRQGPTGVVQLGWIPDYARFTDLVPAAVDTAITPHGQTHPDDAF